MQENIGYGKFKRDTILDKEDYISEENQSTETDDKLYSFLNSRKRAIDLILKQLRNAQLVQSIDNELALKLQNGLKVELQMTSKDIEKVKQCIHV